MNQVSSLSAVRRVVALGTVCAIELRAEGSDVGYDIYDIFAIYVLLCITQILMLEIPLWMPLSFLLFFLSPFSSLSFVLISLSLSLSLPSLLSLVSFLLYLPSSSLPFLYSFIP